MPSRGPDSEPYEVTSDDWQDWEEYGMANGGGGPILEVPCSCCKGLAHADGTACNHGIDFLLAANKLGRPWHVLLNTPLPEWPGCFICFDSGVVPCDAETEETL
jgi:hypothetical protein